MQLNGGQVEENGYFTGEFSTVTFIVLIRSRVGAMSASTASSTRRSSSPSPGESGSLVPGPRVGVGLAGWGGTNKDGGRFSAGC